MMRSWGSVLAIVFWSLTAHAAQTGKVIVDEAAVREFPQEDAKVVAKIARDEVVTVSNQPTSGFFKARVKSGQIGWIAASDLQVKGTKRGAIPIAGRKSAVPPEDLRVMAGYGISMLSYSGLSSAFTTTGLSPNSFFLEGQFRISDALFLALRAQYYTGSATSTVTTGTTQLLDTTLMPVMLGANYTFIRKDAFRLGAGVYAGLSFGSSTKVTWTTGTVAQTVTYGSTDLCFDLAVQGTWYFIESLGLVADVAYHYQKTGEFPATSNTVFSGGKPGFAINYSGITLRGGLEMRF